VEVTVSFANSIGASRLLHDWRQSSPRPRRQTIADIADMAGRSFGQSELSRGGIRYRLKLTSLSRSIPWSGLQTTAIERNESASLVAPILNDPAAFA
jgi:hypothetical protein